MVEKPASDRLVFVLDPGFVRLRINENCQAKAALEVDKLDAVADRGYFDSEEILACDRAGIAVTLPMPLTSAPSHEAITLGSCLPTARPTVAPSGP